jgi:CheY-like chemotaxis protein
MTRALQSFGRPTQPITRKLNVNDLIVDVHRLLRRAIPTTIDFDYHLSDAPYLIEADAGQIQQVIINLCLNARDAMPEGGRLELSTESISGRKLPEQPNNKQLADQYVAIHVRDEGGGMDEETLQKVFDPFFTTKPFDRGTGLGLSIVYQIVESHQGIIQVESTPGKGTHFTVYFPMSVEPTGTKTMEDEPKTSTNERIIVIENEEMVASLIRTMLENRGYDVAMAPDAETAFNLIRDNGNKDFDLAIIDYTMSHLSGEQCLMKLRQHQPGLQAILITGQDVSESDIDIKGCRIVHKPFTVPAMGQTVRQMLDHKLQ